MVLWPQVKLYFMIGLPGETDTDVLGIVETIEWLQRECRYGKHHLAVNVTISNFTPKAHTPFQWHSVSTSEFKQKQNMLKRAFKRLYMVRKSPVNSSLVSGLVFFNLKDALNCTGGITQASSVFFF